MRGWGDSGVFALRKISICTCCTPVALRSQYNGLHFLAVPLNNPILKYDQSNAPLHVI